MEKRTPSDADLPAWPTRDAMVARGLAMNLPWLAFVNISFALMILLRNVLIRQFDLHYLAGRQLIWVVDASMALVIAFSLILVVMGRRQTRGISAVLMAASLCWSLSCYWFVTDWQLPHAWPLCTILLLSAMAALYFYPSGLIAYVTPLWLTLPAASVALNEGLNLRFAFTWLVFSLILIFGRVILLRWFNEAWQRNQQNQLLIARLDALAHQDPLTETANRRAMENILAQAIDQQRPFSVIMLDVDYFKLYNDTYGHQAGDECLARVAQVLKQSVRTPEDLVSRYGGEEFLVILFNCPLVDAQLVATRIQENLRAAAIAHTASKASEYVTASMGIAERKKDKNADEIIALADAALYRAKDTGRNRWSA